MIKFFLIHLIQTIVLIISAYAESTPSIPKQIWSFKGLGVYDRAALQRGFQVYKEVCASCHSFKQVSYHHLSGIGFNVKEIKAIASNYEVTDGPNEEGVMFQRKALPSDPFVSPYSNEKAARAANNGALPVDLSLIIKARHKGADYVYALLTGFTKPPKDLKIGQGRYYNRYFLGNEIAMAPPLQDGQVDFADGTKATVAQMSKDVVIFLAWAAEPEAEYRKKLGLKVMLYLSFVTILFWYSMRRIWKDVKP